ncbi:MAG: Na+/H+ antiporter subunit E [Limnochordia bacterium]
MAKTILFSKPKLSPVVLSMRPAVQSSWGRVLLATAITFTPGSVTIDVDPETGRFIIHTLTEEIADSLIRWNLIDEIAIIETLGQRRLTHEVGTDRTHGFDSPGIAPGNYGADSH